jgi:peptidoglycan/xylan/chitin deacetylase (PgdA/CDA1 family)
VAASAARQALKATAAAADGIRRPAAGLVVLVYHRVGQRTPIEVDLPLMLFTEQIASLADTSTPVTLSDGIDRVTDATALRRPMVSVTFDDGTADFADLALPVLVEHGVPVTIYVATEFVERGTMFPHDGVPISWAALRDAVGTGLVTVGSHTHRHSLLDRLPADQVPGELDRSIDLIGERISVLAEHFAYPKAIPGSPAADAAVRARFRSAALAGTRPNRYGATDRYRLARSPVQVSDGMRWFRRKLDGGLALEDTLRRALAGRRYAGATT